VPSFATRRDGTSNSRARRFLAETRNVITAEIGTSGETARISFPISKVEKSDEGEARFVYGKATGPDLDLDRQIIDSDFVREAFPKWFKSFGNVRQMHSKSLPPAGKAVELHETEDGSQFIRAKIVEPGAIRLVDEGVYSAFSVGLNGVKIVKDLDAPGGRIVAGTFVETSLVDFPANPTCRFEVVKRAGEGDAWEETQAFEVDDEAPEAVKTIVAEVAKAHIETEADEALDAAIVKALDEQRALHVEEIAEKDAEITKLAAEAADWKSQYDKLASEPDPALAPMRGTKLVIPHKDDEPEEDASEAARKRRDAEYRAYISNLAENHPNPETRFHAQAELNKLGEAS
jgi:hypothetical protein